MQELLKRLFRKPGLAAEILIATFFINLLFLASSIYVIQILGRYIPYGFDGTLITLTVGMVLTTVLLFWSSLALWSRLIRFETGFFPEQLLRTRKSKSEFSAF